MSDNKDDLYTEEEPKDQVDEESYYIPGTDESHRIAGMGHMLACKCGRKILVSMGLIGTVHHLGTSVCCADCLEIDETFRREHPDIAKKLEKWKYDTHPVQQGRS